VTSSPSDRLGGTKAGCACGCGCATAGAGCTLAMCRSWIWVVERMSCPVRNTPLTITTSKAMKNESPLRPERVE
jgi:hypothetical protein